MKSWHQLTETSGHTPMGRLLRRYWWPIAGVTELDQRGKLPVRLLGEDLVLYQTLLGELGLIGRRCAHRGADLVNGIRDAHGLRCSYHGWCFDGTGQCIEIPYPPTTTSMAGRTALPIGISGYQVRTLGGLVWAYLGPPPVPLLPDWEFFHWRNGFVQIVISEIPCNWLQCQENSVDPVHFEWQHTNYSRSKESPSFREGPKHLKLKFEEFEYGIVYKRLRTGTPEEDPLWVTGRVCLWPAAVFPGNHIEYRVPIDDEHTLSVGWFFDRVPSEQEPYYQREIPVWHGPVFQDGRCIDTHVINQDFMAWIGQGVVVDRTLERLGPSDTGVSMLRKLFTRDLRKLEECEGDPLGVIRDPTKNRQIRLPVADRYQLIEGLGLREMLNDAFLCERLRSFIFQAGQPHEVRLAFEEAMGIRGIHFPPRDAVDYLQRRPMFSIKG